MAIFLIAIVRFLGVAALLVLAPVSAAVAQSGDAAVPEPNNILLFAIGVLGLILGRRNGRRKD
jgi:hypothetical protein